MKHLAPVLLALAGTKLSSLCGFAAGPVLLLVSVVGALSIAIVSGEHRILHAAAFGVSLLLFNVLQEHRSLLDSEVYTFLLPILLGIPLTTAVLTKWVSGKQRGDDRQFPEK